MRIGNVARVFPALASAVVLLVTGLGTEAFATTGGAARSLARGGTVREGLPGSMAALGDSITQAYDATPTKHILTDQPQYSWSTGYAGRRVVDSQYERLLIAGDTKLKGHEFNDAVTGAKMNDLLAQATEAVQQKAAYVTILIGANDACTHTIGEMTPVTTFKHEFAAAMKELQKGKRVRIFVASIPNLYHLWSLLHTNPNAELIWGFGICQSMLSTGNTQADRLTVLARIKAFNATLESVCRTYADCRFDNDIIFDYKFKASQVSSFDYFHPSIAGQNELAEMTWTASFWPRKR
jgi:lysophospholipase L1-like esterase